MRIFNIDPLRYDLSSHADVVARSLRDYAVTYVQDPAPEIPGGAPQTPAQTHLHLHATPAYFKYHDWWLSDVWYDPATLVPSRIVWGGANQRVLDLRYALVDGAWLVRTLTLTETMRPLGLWHSEFALRCDYDGYRFSDTAPDPRLAPGPSSSAAPKS